MDFGGGWLPKPEDCENPEGFMESLDEAVADFNAGYDCWCNNNLGYTCGSECNECLLCNNCTTGLLDEDRKAALFAEYAISMGYYITRHGLKLSDNLGYIYSHPGVVLSIPG